MSRCQARSAFIDSPGNFFIIIINYRITLAGFGGIVMKALPQISEAEFEVMKIVWKYAPINTNEVTERLTRTTDWQPKTIQTLLKRLVNKGALTYEKEGRIFVYTPLVHEKEYVHQKSRAFLDRYYAGNIASMLSAYLEDDTLTQNEIESLRQLLSGKDSEKTPGRR